MAELVRLQVEPLTNNGCVKARVRAERASDGQLLEIDTVTLDSSRSRTRFVNAVVRQCEGADRDTLNAELVRYADEHVGACAGVHRR